MYCRVIILACNLTDNIFYIIQSRKTFGSHIFMSDTGRLPLSNIVAIMLINDSHLHGCCWLKGTTIQPTTDQPRTTDVTVATGLAATAPLNNTESVAEVIDHYFNDPWLS